MRLFCSLLLALQAPTTPPDTAHIVIVATTDVHGRVLGWDYVRGAATEATYRYVSANVVDDSGKALFAPTVVLSRGAVKIGITGFTTPGVMLWDRAQLAAASHLRVRRIADAAPAAVAALDRAGVDLKVVLIHSGFGSSTYDTTGVRP